MKKLISLLCTLALALAGAPAVAFAQADTSVSATSQPVTTGVTGKAEDAAKSHATREIERRVDNINQVISRLNGMKHLSDNDRSGLQKNLAAQISSLMTLKAKIETDTDRETIKTDVQSITKSYRIYALILPQARVTAAADRVLTIVGEMQALGTKLQTRMSASTSTDVAALQSSYADLQAKLTDASAQAKAAQTTVANLVPDNGDTTTAAANESALKDARAKLEAAQKDLKDARADVKIILKGLKVPGGN
jgi:DNA repair exonuclease SbcCD ATPase subunit